MITIEDKTRKKYIREIFLVIYVDVAVEDDGSLLEDDKLAASMKSTFQLYL